MPIHAARRVCRSSLLAASFVAGAGLGVGGLALHPPETAVAAKAKAKPKIALAKGFEGTVIRQVNAARRTRGLRPLRGHNRLRRSARAHSRFLARTGTPSHVGAGGSTFWQRITRAGYPAGRASGETVGMAFGCHSSFARKIVGQWMSSPPHRRALMRRNYRRIGVGVARTRSCSHTAFVINVAG